MQKRKKHTGLIIALSIIVLLVITAVGTAGIYSHFGGFGTGECADKEEFASYAVPVSELTVPDGAQIIALGEATHGNREFQRPVSRALPYTAHSKSCIFCRGGV